jgi:hypothetical protein
MEWLKSSKHGALSSNPSAVKKKKNRYNRNRDLLGILHSNQFGNQD